MSLIELDITVTFGSGAAATNNTVVSPSVSSATAVGSVSTATGATPNGTLIFATDRLAGVKAAIAANTAPQASAFASLATLNNVWQSQGFGYGNLTNPSTGYYATNRLQGGPFLFACPGYFYDPTDALAIQGFANADMTAAFACALWGYLSNSNVFVVQPVVRNWIKFSTIDQNPNPTGDNGNDAPLIAGTAMNAVIIAACILDEGLNGNWSALTGWTAADRTAVESWIINSYYPALQVIINPFTSGIPASGMLNNWRSWAIYGSALSEASLPPVVQMHSNSTTAATGASYLTATIAALNNAIGGTVSEAGTLTNPITGTQTNAIVTTAFSYTGVSPAVPMNPGDLFLENLRGNDQVHYNYYSTLPLCAAAQVLLAANQTNIFTGKGALLTAALTENLSRLSPLQSGQNSDVPYSYELYEAMGAVYNNANYTAYASPNRPVMPTDQPAATTFQHTSIFSAATLTSLINGYTGGGFNYPNLPAGMTLQSFRSGLVGLPGSETPHAWGQALNQSFPTGVNNMTEVDDTAVPWAWGPMSQPYCTRRA